MIITLVLWLAVNFDIKEHELLYDNLEGTLWFMYHIIIIIIIIQFISGELV